MPALLGMLNGLIGVMVISLRPEIMRELPTGSSRIKKRVPAFLRQIFQFPRVLHVFALITSTTKYASAVLLYCKLFSCIQWFMTTELI